MRWVLVIAIWFLSSPVWAQQGRLLLARSTTTGQWFQRIDTGDKSEAQFAQEVSKQFGISVNQIEVRALPSWEEGTQAGEAGTRLGIMKELAAGTYAGSGVIPAPLPDMREALLLTTKRETIKAKLGLTDAQLDDLKAVVGKP